MGCDYGRTGGGLMRATYRQFDAGPVINLARHPRATAFLVTGQFPKFHNDRWNGDGAYSLLTGITDHPDGITTAARFTATTTPRIGHGFHIAGNAEQNPPISLSQMLPVKPGERITASVWLRYTGTKVQAYVWRFRPGLPDGSGFLDAGQTSTPVTLPSGVWVKVSHTYTVPAGAGSVAFMITASSTGLADAIGDTIDGTGLMVTRTPAPQANIAADPYATALSTPNGKFGWTPQWFGSGATGTKTKIANATDGPNGIATYLRKTWTAMGANLTDVAFTHVATVANQPTATQGESYSFSSYFRASKGWTVTQNCRIVVEWYDGAGVRIGAAVNGSNIATVTAGTWHNLSISNVVAPAGAFSIRAFQMVYVENGTWTVGDTLDGTGLMVTRNPPLWKFADGSSPGWKWLGAVNTSESAGYPIPG